MPVDGWLTVYCLLIAAASLIGARLPAWVRFTHARMQLIISFVAGLMLGVALLQLLPHAVESTRAVPLTMMWTLNGLLAMFFLIRAFDFHHHAGVDEEEHEHGHDHDHGHGSSGTHRLSWLGVFLGLTVHTAIDGAALAAIMKAESIARPENWWGLGVFLAILLHKPLDALSITTVMMAGGWSNRAQLAVAVCFAATCPVGAALFFLGIEQFGGDQSLVIGCALAFSAGVFLCISLGDLLPELHFHGHDRVPLSITLLMGVALAYLISQGHIHPPRDARPRDASGQSGSLNPSRNPTRQVVRLENLE
ncbi:MAG: ZIP family metal transporter [Planctomycetales bacterium]